jgi:hypothetical protein
MTSHPNMEPRQKKDGFRSLRTILLNKRSTELVRLIGELYGLSRENQRFLSARLGDPAKQKESYKRIVAEAMFPDPLRKGAEVRIADAKKAISQYERAAGDDAGTIDLMLTFVEEGTAFATDLGYGDDAFFSSLENMLSRTLERLGESSPAIRQTIQPRLVSLRNASRGIGWGYGDFVADAVARAVPAAE